MLQVRVEVYGGVNEMIAGEPYRTYVMNHDDPAQRRVLGEQCRNAFEAKQCIVTYPVGA